MNLGFIGLGVMGAPMATHLARAGRRLTLLDLDSAAAHELAAAVGGTAAATPADVAAASEIVVTMLADGEAVQQVALGERGLVEGLRPGSLLLDCSSAEPWLTQQTAARLAECGASMVDALNQSTGGSWITQTHFPSGSSTAPSTTRSSSR